MSMDRKKVEIYFPGWLLERAGNKKKNTVAGIPWEYVTDIDHAFWVIEPLEKPEQSSFERAAAGLAARTGYRIRSKSPEGDKVHFKAYSEYKAKYPDVNIKISVGGWTDCGFFSEMASTSEGRMSFADSCAELMERHQWIGGIDIDWEHPASCDDGRMPDPDDPEDTGCPVWGTKEEDNNNFISLLSTLRSVFDERFGNGKRQITACASGMVWSLGSEDWTAAAGLLDCINIMTYDLAGAWDGRTGHSTSLSGCIKAVEYLRNKGVPADKINIGTPLYAKYFRVNDADSVVLGAQLAPETACEEKNELYDVARCAELEKTYGWHKSIDEEAGASYLYNDDPASEYRNVFLSYESSQTLQKKLDYIKDNDLRGIIVWESTQDAEGYPMIRQMHDLLK